MEVVAGRGTGGEVAGTLDTLPWVLQGIPRSADTIVRLGRVAGGQGDSSSERGALDCRCDRGIQHRSNPRLPANCWFPYSFVKYRCRCSRPPGLPFPPRSPLPSAGTRNNRRRPRSRAQGQETGRLTRFDPRDAPRRGAELAKPFGSGCRNPRMYHWSFPRRH